MPILSLHRIFTEPLVWTQSPEDFSSLRKQRVRWQQGLIDTLKKHWRIIGNPRYGIFGTFILPFMIFTEVILPFCEILMTLTLIYCLWLKLIPISFVLKIFAAGIVANTVITGLALYLEEKKVAKTRPFKNYFQLLSLGIFECFGYHQIKLLWIIEGTLRSIFSAEKKWDSLKRKNLKVSKDSLDKAG